MAKEKLLKATHEGKLSIEELKLDVAVLEDGKRVITQNAVFKALGRPQRGNSRVINTPVFMDAKNLQRFIGDDLRGAINKIEFIDKNGKIQDGFDVTILPLVSDLYLKARQEGAITKPNQLVTAQKAEILVRSLAKVGIIALVDEATGYQYQREKTELQAILKAFISDEILKWQETFQLSFYKEIFRLWGVPFTPQNIKRKPMFIGKLTNELVYKKLPKGVFVLDKLKKKTPKTEAGNYKYRLHQSLTPEIGREALKKVIYSVETLASISTDKKQFLKLMADKYGQKEIPFDDLEEIKEPVYEEKKLSTFNKNLAKALVHKPKDKNS